MQLDSKAHVKLQERLRSIPGGYLPAVEKELVRLNYRAYTRSTISHCFQTNSDSPEIIEAMICACEKSELDRAEMSARAKGIKVSK